MDGIHDLGGMHGFGSIEREADEPVFHAEWEGRAFAIDLLVEAIVEGVNIDAFRHAVERIDPATYLAASYYQKWIYAVETILVEHGVLGADEVEARIAALRAEDS